MNKIMICLIVFITLSLAIGAFAADNSKCNYPSPDGGGPNPSPPNIKGKIIKVEPNAIILEPDKSLKPKTKAQQEIRIDNTTQIFTWFGGHVAKRELAPGQEANIWYEGCNFPKKGRQPQAAVVQIDATKDQK